MNTLVIAVHLLLASGCAVRVGHPTDRQSAEVAKPLPSVDQVVVAQATSQPSSDPGAVLTCECLERR